MLPLTQEHVDLMRSSGASLTISVTDKLVRVIVVGGEADGHGVGFTPEDLERWDRLGQSVLPATTIKDLLMGRH